LFQRPGDFRHPALYRLRLLNGCNSRFLWLKFDHPDVEVHFNVDIDASGRPLGVQIARGSGNRFLDESAERAIWKCQPFGAPPPQMPLQFLLVFQPGDRF